jgi:RimJ/RimL family protein N-acetyltransferase
MRSSTASTFDVVSDVNRALEHANKYLKLLRKEKQTGICLVKNDEVLASCVYEEFNGANIWLHCVGTPGKPWLNRDFIYWSFHYPFVQLGAERISLWVEANNLASTRFVEHLGFEREATLARAGQGGVDVFIYRMFKGDCRHVQRAGPDQEG